MPVDGHASLAYDGGTNRITTAGFEYDAAGNQIKAPGPDGSGLLFEYDAAGRISVIRKESDNSLVQAFQYGSTNARLMDTNYGFGYMKLFASTGGTTLAEYAEFTVAVPTWTKSYTYFGSSQLATITPNGSGGEYTEFNHPDRLGTRLVTNQQGGTAYEQVHLPFGTALNAESSLTTNNKRFTSYDRSSATGLDYAINRTYDSKQGRFTTVDPIGMQAVSLVSPQTLNMYTYCGNDPVNYTDPSGLFIKKLFKWIGKVFKWLAIAIVVAVVVMTGPFAPASGSILAKFFGFLIKIGAKIGLATNSFMGGVLLSAEAAASGVVSAGLGALVLYTAASAVGAIANGFRNDDDIAARVRSKLRAAVEWLLRLRRIIDGHLRGMYCLLKAARFGLVQDDNTERAAWITQNGEQVESVRWPWNATSKSERWKGPIPENATAIAHTHPRGSSPKPSTTGGITGKGDHGTATQIGMPVFVVTRDAIWVALPNNKNPIQIARGEWWKKYEKEKTKCD